MLQQTLEGSWQFRQAGSGEWRPATVPGCVHTDLLAAGLIPDPFVGDNEKRVGWVAEADWEYRRAFSLDAALLEQMHIFLVCDGLGTLAEVWLNFELLGPTENMFQGYRWAVRPLLRPGENELSVLFRSPVRLVAERQRNRPLPGQAPKSSLAAPICVKRRLILDGIGARCCPRWASGARFAWKAIASPGWKTSTCASGTQKGA